MRKSTGITMISLIITVVILLILAGASVGVGSNIIKQSQLQNLETNMLLIKTKGKEYVENASFKLGTNIDTAENKDEKIATAKEELKGTEITDMTEYSENIAVNISEDNNNYIYYYVLTTEDLIEMGFEDIESNEKAGWYIIKYDTKNAVVEVYSTNGYSRDDNTYYSLNEIQSLDVELN